MFEIEIRQAEGNRTVLIEEPEVIFGRRNEEREVNVDLNPDTTVSRVHARVWKSDTGVQIEDLGSSLGTIVNGDKLETSATINADDIIQLGETVIRVLGKSSSKSRVSTSKVAAAIDESDSCPKSEYRLEFQLMSAGKRTALKIPRSEAFVGRVNDEHPIDVDISNEPTVSRVHARIWAEDGACWIEDLNSTHGTKVNDQFIEGKTRLGMADEIQIGIAQLRVQMQKEKNKRRPISRARAFETVKPEAFELELPSDGLYPVWKSNTLCYMSPEVRQTGGVRLEQPDLGHVGVIRVVGYQEICGKPEINTDNQRESFGYYRNLLEFPPKLGGATDLSRLCSFVVEHMTKVFPEADRASLFLCAPATNELILEASVPKLKPAVSPLLAQQAFVEGRGHIWKQSSKEESMQRLSIHGGMYAPMKIGAIEIGLICVGATDENAEYRSEDLGLLIAMAQIAAPHVRLLSENQ